MSDYIFVCNLQVKVQAISNAECGKALTPHRRHLHEKQICAYDANSTFKFQVSNSNTPSKSRPRSGKGDSGGPMMCGSEHNVLVGIISSKESTNWLTICTRVSEFREWIQKNTAVFYRGMFVSVSFCRSVYDQTILTFCTTKYV